MSDERCQSKNRSINHISTSVLQYYPSQREGPSQIDKDVTSQMFQEVQAASARAKLVDFGWMLARQPFEDTLFNFSENTKQVIPAWTAFNIRLHEDNAPRECCISYSPIIESSPTELPTVFTLLKKSLQTADQLGQQDVIVVLDQAIYAKALEIVWQDPQQFHRVVLRMGAFHTICAFMAAIGKRFADAGLADILIESDIVATGSVSGVLEGRHYNRAVRMHKVGSVT